MANLQVLANRQDGKVIYFKQKFISERRTTMVTKKKKQSATQKRGKVKVSDLKLNKETVKDLTSSELEKVQGGVAGHTITISQVSCGGGKL